MPNKSTEDYVKNIYKLQNAGTKVTTSALATALELSDPSITDMIKKLSEKGYVSYEKYQGAVLTKSGKRMALKIVRRHRLWEMYLAKFLGFSWDRVHDEAERLEHVMSEELEASLDKALGYPTVDPHGDPIPTAEGDLDAAEYTPLAHCDAGDVVEVLRVSDDSPAILQHASKLGIRLNGKITVRDRKDFDGSLVVKVGTKQHFLSKQVAEAIFVEKVT